MRAAWYDRRGPARDVLVVGDLPDPEPGPGEVRIRVSASGINSGDVKKRGGWQGSPMPYPRVIPHSDGAGVIDATGPGVDGQRVGQKVWCYGAQSYRPFGTAAKYCVVPDALAGPLPDTADTELLDQAACLGIAGIAGDAWSSTYEERPTAMSGRQIRRTAWPPSAAAGLACWQSETPAERSSFTAYGHPVTKGQR